MRRLLIDTDTGTDDAVAIVMALRDANVRVEAFTTVAGNVGVARATENCLISIEQAGTYSPPVYVGAHMPLVKPVEPHDSVTHGVDGMGDLGLKAPGGGAAEDESALSFLARYISENPGELEMVTIGPVTNLALLCHYAPGTLAKLKRIYMMMGTGVWFGNSSPMAEGNASMDPEALDVVLRCAETEIVLIGWDQCIGESLFTEQDIASLYATGSPVAKFCLDINHTLMTLNERRFGARAIDFADPVAMAVALQPDIIKRSVTAYHRTVTAPGISYGAIAVDAYGHSGKPANATTVVQLYTEQMKKCICERIV